ncbi:MAG TPA: bifunctional GNAT family N-acetyltransferase/acetate--CoA ligase family protein [Terriglobia bacterium]|nr:bifunctional GNAT family N-acetyltransferase/acetate--CoA ligase family protein [Terriglobia bacterium]
MRESHPLYMPAPYQDAVDSGRLIMRDGSVAAVRRATPDDVPAMRDFFARLSPESRRRRLFSLTGPSEEFIRSLCDSHDPLKQISLVITRKSGETEVIIAVGSYMVQNKSTAEVAMAVEDRFQGQGLGTQLLERLALMAIRNGLSRFWAVTELDNRSMIHVFRNSGLAPTENVESGSVEVDFSIVPTEASVTLSETRDRLSTAASIRPFFYPNAVAVIGASREPAAIGHRILDELVRNGFAGAVYPVNPKAGVVGSIRAYPSIAEVPEQVDLAVIAVPRNAVLQTIDDCAAKGVRAVIVITAGFSETGPEGHTLQDELVEKVRGYGMRMVGPNCLGLLNTDPAVRLNASFSPIFPKPGRLAMSSQSGALGLAILALAGERGLGLSTFASIGNKADVSSNDLLQYWEADESAGVILLYLESFGNPRRFARIARRVSRSKPIIAVKAGRKGAGSRAAGSHTAALAASEVAVEALFRQTGVIRADSLDEMFDIANALGSQPLMGGRRVAIITNAGGPAILCADACEAGGLVIPVLSETLKAKLRVFLPATASVTNPVDMIASATPEAYRRTIETVLTSNEIDAVIVIHIPVDRSSSAPTVAAIREGIRDARAASGERKPILTCLMSSEGGAPLEVDGEKIPVYTFPESAGRALSKVASYSDWLRETPGVIPGFNDMRPKDGRRIVKEALATRGGNTWLTADECHRLLDAFGIPQAPGEVAHSPDEAARIAEQIGFPVAMKLASERVLHKTESGGVRLNVRDAATARSAFDEVRRADPSAGVLVQQMMTEGIELMVGVAEDRLFGPLIGFGLGGIHVEVLADVAFRITPLTDRDAYHMTRSIRGFKLLQGFRGHPPADLAAIEETLLRVSQMVTELPEIRELDLNPLFAFAPGEGCRVADARIRVEG